MSQYNYGTTHRYLYIREFTTGLFCYIREFICTHWSVKASPLVLWEKCGPTKNVAHCLGNNKLFLLRKFACPGYTSLTVQHRKKVFKRAFTSNFYQFKVGNSFPLVLLGWSKGRGFSSVVKSTLILWWHLALLLHGRRSVLGSLISSSPAFNPTNPLS